MTETYKADEQIQAEPASELHATEQKGETAPAKEGMPVAMIFFAVVFFLYVVINGLILNEAKRTAYQDGYAVGVEDAMTGAEYRANEPSCPEDYPYGGARWSRYMLHWPTGYRDGYEATIEKTEGSS